MHPFKIKKLAAVNDAVNAIYLDLKAFNKTIKPNADRAGGHLVKHILGGCRQIEVFICWDIKQGFQIIATAYHGFLGTAQHTFFYTSTHADISRLFSQAFEMAQINSDASYSRAERSFTGC